MTDTAWAGHLQQKLMEIVGTFGNIELHAEPGSAQAARARRGSLAALALANEARSRIVGADLTAEQQAVAGSGYDLAALATTVPSGIEE